MSRQRILSPDFFTDERICSLPPLDRLLFQGLWGLADREGRLVEKPFELKLKLMPVDEIDINKSLGRISECGLIQRYEVGSLRLIWIPNFLKFQKPHMREAPSTLPPPSKTSVNNNLDDQKPGKGSASTNLGRCEPGKGSASPAVSVSVSVPVSVPVPVSVLKEGSKLFVLTPPDQPDLIKTKPKRQPPNPEVEFQRFVGSMSPDEKQVFGQYEKSTGLILGADWALLKFIRGKLKNHTVDEICRAIQGHAGDAWNRERGNLGLRVMLSDASKIAISAQRAAAQ